MKVFLSPLFATLRMCRHCVQNFYRSNPDAWAWPYELEKMPPLGYFEARKGFQPDLSILLMFDEFAIDGEAYERLTSRTAPSWLGTWPNVMRALNSEGSISLVDTHRERIALAPKRSAMVRRDLRDPSKWASAMAYHDTLLAKVFTLDDDLAKTVDIDWIFRDEEQRKIPGPDSHLHTPWGVLSDPDESPSSPHAQMRQESLSLLRSQLSEFDALLAISSVIGAAPMFWAPYKGFAQTKLPPESLLQEGEETANASRQFFDLAFPRYQPSSIKDLLRLRRDSRITDLRNEVVRAARAGDLLEPDYAQRALEEVLRIEKHSSRIRRVTGWLSSLVGLIPGTSIFTTAAGEVIGNVTDRELRRKFDWLYLISDGRGNS